MEKFSGVFITSDLFFELTKGSMAGHSAESKFGANATVGTTNEVIWDGGGAFNWIPSVTALKISSSSTDDDIGGVGALTLNIYGTDTNYLIQNETINLDGQVQVTTINTYTSIYRLEVATEGSNAAANVGDIYIYIGTETLGVPDTATQIYAKISAGNGQTLMTPYIIPAGKTGYLVHGWASSAAGKNAGIQFFARPFNGARNLKFDFDILNNNFSKNYRCFPKFLEKTALWIESKVDTGTTKVSAGYDLILVDNSF